MAEFSERTTEKVGVKGKNAEPWLKTQGIDIPPATYDTRRLAGGGIIVRLGTADFILEAGESGRLPTLPDDLPDIYRVERQDATFVLEGERVLDVLGQLCSIDFRTAPVGKLILTRAGGVNCAILPGERSYRIWVDPTFAEAFGESVRPIVAEMVAGKANTRARP